MVLSGAPRRGELPERWVGQRALGPLGVGILAAISGAALGLLPSLGPLLPVGITTVAVMARRRWVALATVTLGGLVLLSYGFNNIPARLGGVAMPAVDVVIPVVAVMAYPIWREAAVAAPHRSMLVAVGALWLCLGVRLALDMTRYGVVAARDALFGIEILALAIGVALVRTWGHRRTTERLNRLLVLAVGWFLLYPFRDQLAALGPQVGVQKPVPLVAMTSAGLIAACALVWFVLCRRPGASAVAVAAALVVLVYQARGLYLGVPLSLLLVGVVGRWAAGAGPAVAVPVRLTRAIAVVTVGFLVLAVAPPLNGRIAPARPDVVAEQLGTLVGREGPGSGSAQAREEWWSTVMAQAKSSPERMLFGLGLGADLTGGFRGRDGAEVRKPHNDFLEVFARLGLVGFGAWCCLMALGIAALVRRARTGCRIAQWALASQPVFLLVSLTQPLFGFAYGGAVYWAMVGLGVGCTCHGEELGPPADAPTTAAAGTR